MSTVSGRIYRSQHFTNTSAYNEIELIKIPSKKIIKSCSFIVHKYQKLTHFKKQNVIKPLIIRNLIETSNETIQNHDFKFLNETEENNVTLIHISPILNLCN